MSISAHEDRRHRCHLCGIGFIYPHKLQEHLNTHTGDKPFKCKFCNAAFASSSNKRMHERAHLGIKVKQSKKQQQWIKKKKPWNQSTAQFEENTTKLKNLYIQCPKSKQFHSKFKCGGLKHV